MAAYGHLEFGCGRRRMSAGGGGREPFVFPGTERRYAPDRSADIRHTRIEIALDPEVIAIEGSVTHDFTSLSDDMARLHLHAGELAIEGASDESGAELTFRQDGEDLYIDLRHALAFDESGTVTVRYSGTPRRGIYFIHPDAGYPDKAYQVWTQGQDEDSRYWFPGFDHPTEKFSSEVLARVPAKYTAVSNGALQGKTTHADGTVTWHWSQEAEHSAYLVTLCVGAFEELVLGDDPVPLTAYVPKGRRAIAERAFGRTAEMVKHLSERFGVPYPYEKYAQVVVEDFIFGGMENTSATTLIDLVLYDDRAALDFDLDDLIAHELAHQWWGDLLTCREWPHAWLNEGFATWTQVVWKEHAEGPDSAAWERFQQAANYRTEDAGEYRRAIVDRRFEEPIDLFDHHLYEKGSCVLHMLRRELGEDAFWRAITTYAELNRGGSVVTEDLRVAIEAATGRNLDWFLDQWVYHAGHPELTVSYAWDAATKLLAVTVTQTQKTGDEMVDVFRANVDVHVTAQDGTRCENSFPMTRRDHTFHVALENEPARVEVDPDGDLLAVIKLEQPAKASRATLASDAPLAARIRAAHALTEEPTPENVAALAAELPTAFHGLAAECAKALSGMRTMAARDALIAALGTCEDPKSRKGLVIALGAFRHDDVAGAALAGVLENGDASQFVEAAAATALGRTRAAGAKAALLAALESKDAWAEAIRIGCVQGLAALGSEDVVDAITSASAYGRHPRLRAAAIRALGAVGQRMALREPILETLADRSEESDLRIVISAAAALRAIGDPRGVGILAGAPARHPDGRVRREAKAASLRLGKAGGRAPEVARMSDDLEKLRKQNATLIGRMEKLEARWSSEPESVDGPASQSSPE